MGIYTNILSTPGTRTTGSEGGTVKVICALDAIVVSKRESRYGSGLSAA
jgi:hypothetical protein